MIVVTGANGKLGHAVVEQLLELVPPTEIIACVRDPEKSQSFTARGVQVRHGDYDDCASLVEAFKGANRLLIVSASGLDYRTRVQRHCNAIDAALEVDVGHIYYTSLLPNHDSVAYVMKAHLETEDYLRSSGATFTVLKNGVYIEAWPRYLGDVSSGEAVVPDDGPIAWVSRDDLATGTAQLLVQGGYANDMVALTGIEVCNLAMFTTEFNRINGEQVKLRIASVEDYINRQIAAGQSEEVARHWATTYAALARGEFSRSDSFLQQLIERPLHTIADVLTSQAET